MEKHDYISAIRRAIAKQKRIIEREGDADGQRLEPWYLQELIQEQLCVEEFAGSLK